MGTGRASEKQERLARAYDAEIWPLYAQRFARLLLRNIDVQPATAVLEAGCATGNVTQELARRLDNDSRLVAIEPSPALLEVATTKLAASPAGARVELRGGWLDAPLPLGDGELDVAISNLAIADLATPPAAIAELARVLKPGGQLALTVPLRGTWGEFLDVYRDVLRELGRTDALRALQSYVERIPEGDTAARWLESAGFEQVDVDVDRWELLFKSAREFFFAPLIELVPLSRWKHIAGRGDELQDAFFFAKEAIDSYFAESVFSVSVVGACVKGWKPISL